MPLQSDFSIGELVSLECRIIRFIDGFAILEANGRTYIAHPQHLTKHRPSAPQPYTGPSVGGAGHGL